MRSKTHYSSISLKLILICLAFLFLLFLLLRSSTQIRPFLINYSSVTTQQSSNSTHPNQQPGPKSCTKISPSLAEAMVHYATSNITPQQTKKEISVSLRVLQEKSPCNFLVFGLGHDSLLWTSLNHGGRTVFLEEDQTWIDTISAQLPSLESYHVAYNTKLTQAEDLLRIGLGAEECKAVIDPRFSKCDLALKGLPNEVYEMEWDLIMVDAPTGYHGGAPGRMGAIYTAGLMARNRGRGGGNEEGVGETTHVFVHDVDRVVEDKFSKSFLCQGYLTEQEGRIRHFTIPSHRGTTRPFCP